MTALNAKLHRSRENTGFTLIELVMALAILGILFSVALPSYEKSVFKARRAEAKTLLLDLAMRQEQLMLDNSTYSSDLIELGYSEPGELNNNQYYLPTIDSCQSGTIATCFVLTAIPIKGSQQDNDEDCTSFSIDSFGRKTATGDAKNECW